MPTSPDRQPTFQSIITDMSRQVPRLRLFGGDHRSSVWLGLAQLLMPDEYKRVEAIRRNRRERRKREKEKAPAEEAGASDDAGGVTAIDANAATGDENTNGADNATGPSDAGGDGEGDPGGDKADEPSAGGTPESAEEPDNHQDHKSDGEPVEHGSSPAPDAPGEPQAKADAALPDTGTPAGAEPSDDQGTSRNGHDSGPSSQAHAADGTSHGPGEQPPSTHRSNCAVSRNRGKTNDKSGRGREDPPAMQVIQSTNSHPRLVIAPEQQVQQVLLDGPLPHLVQYLIHELESHDPAHPILAC
ncbi:hypothetical protein ABEF95_002944 [Exophiala dermatitidis]